MLVVVCNKKPRGAKPGGVSGNTWEVLGVFLVLRAGLEPACLSALPPQDSASTNFAT
ncbi:hypothetical protein PSAC2689_10036 [Paraburkholderia sacchari]